MNFYDNPDSNGEKLGGILDYRKLSGGGVVAHIFSRVLHVMDSDERRGDGIVPMHGAKDGDESRAG